MYAELVRMADALSLLADKISPRTQLKVSTFKLMYRSATRRKEEYDQLVRRFASKAWSGQPCMLPGSCGIEPQNLR